jgi:hypothetical protein
MSLPAPNHTEHHRLGYDSALASGLRGRLAEVLAASTVAASKARDDRRPAMAAATVLYAAERRWQILGWNRPNHFRPITQRLACQAASRPCPQKPSGMRLRGAVG